MSYAGAGLIILSSDAQCVLLIHDARSHKWGFPKGHREPDDCGDLHTATREVWEETGLTSEDYVVFPEVFKISKGSQSYLFRYAILKDEGRKTAVHIAANNHEISEYRWVPLRVLLEATEVLDGNKYLRTWIADVRDNIPKKSVNLLRALCSRIAPLQESASTSNIVACA
jgi:8-oxo-dGTP pyrophosphatase MutT (NUDIX family)